MVKSQFRQDVESIVFQARVPYPVALKMLEKHKGDLVDALMELTCEPEHTPTPTPKRPDINQTWRRGTPLFK